MKRLSAVLVGASLVLPLPALAEMSDVDYCRALAATYRADHSAGASTSTEIAAALDSCPNKARDSIPVLERALNARKIPLPRR